VSRVIRRSFRIGLWLGLIAGVTAAVIKLVQARQAPPEPVYSRAPTEPARPWPRLDEPVAAPSPAPAPATAAAAPRAAAREREPVRWADAPVTEVDLAPLPEPEAVAAPEPARPAETPVKKTTPVRKAAPPRRQLVAKKAAAGKAAAKKTPAKKVLPTWVDPKGNICPKAHPVKAKLSSKIFQVPGMFAYDRTRPDRCYRDPDAAEADGFRAAKR
jgi:hypothetical protein